MMDLKRCMTELGDGVGKNQFLKITKKTLVEILRRAITAEKAVDDMSAFIMGLGCPRGIVEIDPDCNDIDCKECIKDYFMQKAREE